MFGITDIVTYIIGAVFIVILPGPNTLYIMSIASRSGIRAGYAGVLGIFAGDVVLILCTVLGAASLLHAFPWLFIILKMAGALYLFWLGIKLLISGWHTWHSKMDHETSAAPSSLSVLKQPHPFRTALTISILNPKAIVFYLSFFIQFVDPAYPYPAVSFAILSVILLTLSMVYLSMLIFSGIKLAAFFNRRYKVTAVAIICIGLLFCGFGLKLATSSLG
ncbi:leucine efflux protein LeuE [Acinetobacter sp. WZC-1]|uniref:leucine efflux protein LeuE n=1 Tax=Acinetobacter sp. WZC-1 TaxID=3459034 RepID=UPI00403D6B22